LDGPPLNTRLGIPEPDGYALVLAVETVVVKENFLVRQRGAPVGDVISRQPASRFDFGATAMSLARRPPPISRNAVREGGHPARMTRERDARAPFRDCPSAIAPSQQPCCKKGGRASCPQYHPRARRSCSLPG